MPIARKTRSQFSDSHDRFILKDPDQATLEDLKAHAPWNRWSDTRHRTGTVH